MQMGPYVHALQEDLAAAAALAGDEAAQHAAQRLAQALEPSLQLRLLDLLSDKPLDNEIQRPKRLLDAMRYGSLNGGKRLRPFLVVESAALFGVPDKAALLAGAALTLRRRTA